ncbi:hypothetical protein CTI14_71315, partial [Methylobacterium radiotolerans]
MTSSHTVTTRRISPQKARKPMKMQDGEQAERPAERGLAGDFEPHGHDEEDQSPEGQEADED